MKRTYFVEDGYWKGCVEHSEWYMEEWEAIEAAQEYWSEATQEMRDNGYYVCVETAEVPDEIDGEDAWDWVWENADMEGVELYEKEVEEVG